MANQPELAYDRLPSFAKAMEGNLRLVSNSFKEAKIGARGGS